MFVVTFVIMLSTAAKTGDPIKILGGGSILGGLVLAALAAFITDRHFMKAAGFALAGAALTFFGFMHGEKIGFGQTPVVAVSDLAVGAIPVSCAKFATVTAKAPEPTKHEPAGGLPEAAA